MTEFDGNCPKCQSEEIGLLNAELQGEFIVVGLICTDCEHEFFVSFDNGKVLDD
jgi:hypothetical protein